MRDVSLLWISGSPGLDGSPCQLLHPDVPIIPEERVKGQMGRVHGSGSEVLDPEVRGRCGTEQEGKGADEKPPRHQ